MKLRGTRAANEARRRQAGCALARIDINGATIVDWPSFHDECSRAFQFFDGYGRNQDAWIDCMTDLHGPDALSGLRLPAEEPIEIVVRGSVTLAKSHPEILAEFMELVRYANDRYAEVQERVRITVIEARPQSAAHHAAERQTSRRT